MLSEKICNICCGELPAVLKRLGVDELEIFSSVNTKSIIITAIK